MQLAGTMIIARLLTPAEIGIFAVAAVFAAFASTFRDFGVAEYLIQEKELTSDKIRAAMTANIAVSWLMALLLIGTSGTVAEFYRHAGVAEVMRVQAINFLFIPFGAVTMAYFRRQLDFRPMFVASMLSNMTTFTVATLCALSGLGYMSLAWSSLAGVLVTVATSVWYRPADFPRLPGLAELRGVVRFGKYASGIYLFGQAGRSAPEIIIGRTLDMPSVAFFSRAGGLIELFHKTVLRAVMPVCLPYFAKSSREKGDIVSGYLRVVSYLTAIGWPFFTFLGFVAYGAIRIIYGPQWASSVPLAQILCASALVEVVHFLAKEAIIAAGHVDRSNSLQFWVQGSRILGLLAVIPFGLAGAAWGLAAASVVGTLFAQWMLWRTVSLRPSMTIQSCLPSAYITLFSVWPVSLWMTFIGISEANFIHVVLGGGIITGALWLVAVRRFLPSLWAEIVGFCGRLPMFRANGGR
jgi:O-antigen/teichoic acid export membrane protein